MRMDSAPDGLDRASDKMDGASDKSQERRKQSAAGSCGGSGGTATSATGVGEVVALPHLVPRPLPPAAADILQQASPAGPLI